MTKNNSDVSISFPILRTKRLDLIEINQNHLTDMFKLFSDENVTEFYNIKIWYFEALDCVNRLAKKMCDLIR